MELNSIDKQFLVGIQNSFYGFGLSVGLKYFQVISVLKHNKEEMMRGVDWNQVHDHIGITQVTKEEVKTGIPKIMSKSQNLSDTSWPLLRWEPCTAQAR